jgi:predicted nucleic acid-binding protein
VTVITDTSVVLNLCLIGQQELLRLLYGRILAPTMVVVEFQRLAAEDARFQGLAFPGFIEKAAPLHLLPALTASARLDAGEVAALSLAVERKANAVLMDEQAGRAAAASLGLRAIGLLGILRDAKEQSLIPAVAPLLDRLEQETDFWISASLRSAILKAVGEIS